ncbi:hypothetical protein EYV94_21140 [Puteibacter caeruleilacunae]|nr:hypothetical protein EYV94_21140 [Puteibacter caeruleilacunae]
MILRTLIAVTLVFATMQAFCQTNDKRVKLSDNEGILTVVLHDQSPNQEGVYASKIIDLGEYEMGYYFSDERPWPMVDNRLFPWAFKNSLKKLFTPEGQRMSTKGTPDRNGQMIILKEKSGSFLTILTVSTPEVLTKLHVDEQGTLTAQVMTLGTAPLSGTIPMLTWSRSTDIYAACYQAYNKALQHPVIKLYAGRREEKKYPEMFNYLGWCSWEQYKKNIDQEVLTKAYKKIDEHKLPIRWFLVDDGHQDDENRRLKSFNPSAKKFPNDWQFLNSQKEKGNIKWTGLWHAFNAHWTAISKENTLDDQQFINNKNLLLVKDDSLAANKFYNDFMQTISKQGFDFVKIDVQTRSLLKYTGTNNAVKATHYMTAALEHSTEKHLNGLINCMAMQTPLLLNWKGSAVTRVSKDYKLGDINKAKDHIYQSYSSTLWLGYSVFPDHDMFHSCDRVCGQLMAVSKAMSCAPVYLSDDPDDFIDEYITPLCYADGELVKPLAPAVPLERSALIEVFDESNAYNVIAPLANNCAAIVSYNLTNSEDPIKETITAKDYQDASAMMLPYKGKKALPKEGLVIYDWYKHKGAKLADGYNFSLKGFSDRLLLMAPIENDWAVIGNVDKYLAPATVANIQTSEKQLKVKLREGGKLVIYSASTPSCKNYTCKSVGNNFYEINVPATKQNVTLVLRRS